MTSHEIKEELKEILKTVIPMGIKTNELNIERLSLLIIQAGFTRPQPEVSEVDKPFEYPVFLLEEIHKEFSIKQSKPSFTTSEVDEANEIAFGIFTGEKLSEITKEHIKFAVINLLNAGYRLHLQSKEVDSKWPERKFLPAFPSPYEKVEAEVWNVCHDAFMEVIKQSKPELQPLIKDDLTNMMNSFMDCANNDGWETEELSSAICKKFGRKAVMPSEIDLKNIIIKTLANTPINQGEWDAVIKTYRNEVLMDAVAKSIIKHLEDINK